jgi:hypothetical protein
LRPIACNVSETQPGETALTRTGSDGKGNHFVAGAGFTRSAEKNEPPDFGRFLSLCP